MLTSEKKFRNAFHRSTHYPEHTTLRYHLPWEKIGYPKFLDPLKKCSKPPRREQSPEAWLSKSIIQEIGYVKPMLTFEDVFK